MEVSWSIFKSFIDSRGLSAQEFEIDEIYFLAAFDGFFKVTCEIKKESPKSSDQSDYEDNYQSNANQKYSDNKGHMVMAPTFEDDQGLTGQFKGYKYDITANSLNIFDEEILNQIMLRGGWYQLLTNPSSPKAVVGDYVEFSIVDKNDVLGLFSTYGLTVGVDVLELNKFVRNDYVNPWDSSRQMFRMASASEVYSGLFSRFHYNSTGATGFPVKVMTISHDS